MTFLSMVQRLHAEAGVSGAVPATVIGQTGTALKLVNWILTAYEAVQSLHETWLFRRADFSFNTVAATQNYPPATVGLTDLAAWWFNPNQNDLSGIRIYSAYADETDLIYIPWDEYRATYKMGSFRSQTERPTIFSINPDLSFDLWAIPNDIFTVNGEYVKNMQTMAADASVPVLPDYHMVIVWKALMLYGAFEGAPDVYAHGQNEYEDLLPKLEFNQLPKMAFGPSMA